MQKALYTVLFLGALLVSLVGTAAAAPVAAKSATLVSVDYATLKGPVFTFDVTGKFSRAELRGKLEVVGGGEYGLYCTQVDSDTVTCNSSKKVANVSVTLFWGGSTFSAYVPGPSQFCYDIYDWDAAPANAWVNYGTFCQESRAQYGDSMLWDNPVFGPSLYQYLPESPDQDWCPFYRPGDAYYYYHCDGQPT